MIYGKFFNLGVLGWACEPSATRTLQQLAEEMTVAKGSLGELKSIVQPREGVEQKGSYLNRLQKQPFTCVAPGASRSRARAQAKPEATSSGEGAVCACLR